MERDRTEFEGKAITVTGAGSGIGAEIALRLSARGACVVVGDIDAQATERVVAEIAAAGGTATALRVDVTDPTSVGEMVATCERLYGGLDGCVNNAGVATPRIDLAEISAAEWSRQIAVNLTGVFHCLQAEIPALLRRGGGSIVNTASLTALVAVARTAGYTAAKHGVAGLTKVAALDYATRNIRVNAIAPGYVDTPLLHDRSAEERAEIAARHPINRMAEAGEIAEAALFLLSERASFVTGTVLSVDGAYVTR